MATGDAGLIFLGRIREIMNAMKVMMVRERIHGAGAGTFSTLQTNPFRCKADSCEQNAIQDLPRDKLSSA